MRVWKRQTSKNRDRMGPGNRERGLTTKSDKGTSSGDGNSLYLTTLVTHLNILGKTHWIINFKRVYLTVSLLYLSKHDKEGRQERKERNKEERKERKWVGLLTGELRKMENQVWRLCSQQSCPKPCWAMVRHHGWCRAETLWLPPLPQHSGHQALTLRGLPSAAARNEQLHFQKWSFLGVPVSSCHDYGLEWRHLIGRD